MKLLMLNILWAATLSVASSALSQTSCYDQTGDGFIGVYADPSGTQPCISAAPMSPTTLYLIAVTNGRTGSGISAAEFRVEVSAPSGYFFSYTAPAGTTTFGDPMDLTPGVADAKGLNIAFPSCRPASNQMPGDHVDLGTIAVLNFGGGPTNLLVKSKYPPSSPNWLCPLFSLCDAPAYTRVCTTLREGDPALGGREPVAFRAWMNDTGCYPCTETPPPPPPAPLGLYADSLGTQTALCADQGVPTALHLVASSPDITPGGITGVDFRIEVANPTGYLFSYSPPTGATAFGDPFDLTPLDPDDRAGTSVFFSSCQPVAEPRQAGSRIDLGIVNVLNVSGTSTGIRVRRKNPPDDPTMPCVRFFLCDVPLFTPICVTSGSGSDVVYETTLNEPACLPPPFATETLHLDAHEDSNDGAAGPVSTVQPLDRRLTYMVTVQGTLSLYSAVYWNSPPNLICGIPERLPQMQSPGVTNYWLGSDCEVQFSSALPPGGDCSAQGRHPQRFEVDLDSGFSHLEPIGGVPADPAPSHVYRYLVNGHDRVASFRWVENQTSDDYGILTITVEEVNPTDVPETPRHGRITMLGSVPNPFNPSTEILYVLPEAGEVTVDIFDIRGRVIRHLFAGMQAGGYRTVLWDGKRDDGSKAASGTYYARVLSSRGAGVGRLTLLK